MIISLQVDNLYSHQTEVEVALDTSAAGIAAEEELEEEDILCCVRCLDFFWIFFPPWVTIFNRSFSSFCAFPYPLYRLLACSNVEAIPTNDIFVKTVGKEGSIISWIVFHRVLNKFVPGFRVDREEKNGLDCMINLWIQFLVNYPPSILLFTICVWIKMC